MVIFLITGDKMSIFRRVRGRFVWWRDVHGDLDVQREARGAAMDLDDLAVSAGGWAKALSFGLDTVKPIETPGVASGVLRHNSLDRYLWELESSGSNDSPSP